MGIPLLTSLLLLAPWPPLQAAAPEIVSQSGSLEVRTGGSFAAFVTAEGEALDYQWFRDGEPLEDRTTDTLLITGVTSPDAGNYHVEITNTQATAASVPITLGITTPPALGIAPGTKGIVSVPGHPAYYDLYLPSIYGSTSRKFPVLFTYSPSGGGMVDHFRTVAEEKKWIVVGVSQSRNGLNSENKGHFMRPVFQHVLDNLAIDPNRIFTTGMSGGGWASFDVAKQQAPLVAGILSMGGWLGQQYSRDRDLFLPGLLVARGNGDSDVAANSWLTPDRNYLLNYLSTNEIRDWRFPGGHVPSPESVQREVFDWLLSLTVPSSAQERNLASQQEALWKARITAGEGPAVFGELVEAAFNSPRTPRALAAWKSTDFLFAEEGRFLRNPPPALPLLPHRRRDRRDRQHGRFPPLPPRLGRLPGLSLPRNLDEHPGFDHDRCQSRDRQPATQRPPADHYLPGPLVRLGQQRPDG